MSQHLEAQIHLGYHTLIHWHLNWAQCHSDNKKLHFVCNFVFYLNFLLLHKSLFCLFHRHVWVATSWPEARWGNPHHPELAPFHLVFPPVSAVGVIQATWPGLITGRSEEEAWLPPLMGVPIGNPGHWLIGRLLLHTWKNVKVRMHLVYFNQKKMSKTEKL